MDTAEPISIAYAFTFTDGAVTRITARLDPKTLALLRTTEPSRPDWTRLEAVGCPSCPLFCPELSRFSALAERHAVHGHDDLLELFVRQRALIVQ